MNRPSNKPESQTHFKIEEDIHGSDKPAFRIDAKTFRILDANKLALQLYRYTHEEFLKKTIFKLRPEEDREEALDNAELSRNEKNFVSNLKHVKKNGDIINIRAIAYRFTTDKYDVWVMRVVKVL